MCFPFRHGTSRRNESKEFAHEHRHPAARPSDGLATGTWRLDPARSSVEFYVRHLYGLITVKGRFDRYQGSLDLSVRPSVELVIDADSLDTKVKRRDKHLRSDDFFDVVNHPQVRFEADAATLDGNTLKAPGLGSPMGIMRAPSKLIVRGRLVRAEDA